MRELERASSETAREGLANPPWPLRGARDHQWPLRGARDHHDGGRAAGGESRDTPSPSRFKRRAPRVDNSGVARAQPTANRLGLVAVVGRGRLGHALTRSLASAGVSVQGPFGRGAHPTADVVLLCVPDAQIAAAVELVPPGGLVGHCSGAAGLEILGDREAFSLHPLMTVADGRAQLRGAGCAIAGSTPQALRVARALADALQMRAVEVADRDRAAYHAAASMASNYLVALEAAAERLAATAGVERALLAPLVRAAVDNWEHSGPQRALTGPIARGDQETVARQRAAVAARTPELVVLFDALADVTRALALRAPAASNGREPTS